MSSPKGSVNGLAPKRRPEQPHHPSNLTPQHVELIDFIANHWSVAIQEAEVNRAAFFQPSPTHKDSKAADPEHLAQRPRNT